MSLVICSVPHSGTHFLQDMLQAHSVTVDKAIHPTADVTIDATHIITPLRHPRAVLTSWRRRYSETGSSWPQWRELWETIANLPAHRFCLDGHQASELQRLSNFVGTEVRTDWKPVNSSENDIGPSYLQSGDLEFAMDMYDWMIGQTAKQEAS